MDTETPGFHHVLVSTREYGRSEGFWCLSQNAFLVQEKHISVLNTLISTLFLCMWEKKKKRGRRKKSHITLLRIVH